jgi:hypothetical protein
MRTLERTDYRFAAKAFRMSPPRRCTHRGATTHIIALNFLFFSPIIGERVAGAFPPIIGGK